MCPETTVLLAHLGQKEAASLSHRKLKAVGCNAPPMRWATEGPEPGPAGAPRSTAAQVVTNSLWSPTCALLSQRWTACCCD